MVDFKSQKHIGEETAYACQLMKTQEAIKRHKDRVIAAKETLQLEITMLNELLSEENRLKFAIARSEVNNHA